VFQIPIRATSADLDSVKQVSLALMRVGFARQLLFSRDSLYYEDQLAKRGHHITIECPNSICSGTLIGGPILPDERDAPDKDGSRAPAIVVGKIDHLNWLEAKL
jgi:hypothetical protein